MSGIKVISLILSIIMLIDTTSEVYKAIKDLKDLPKVFKEVQIHLPIVQDTLKSMWSHAQKTTSIVTSAMEIKSLLKNCKAKAKELLDIFKQIEDSEDKSIKVFYCKVVLKVGKEHKVESIMDAILKDVQVLASHHVMQLATQVQVEKLQTAIEGMAKVKPSVPNHYFDAATGKFNHSGKGDLNIQYGDGGMNNVKGNMYTAGSMVFSLKSCSKRTELSDDSD